MSARLKIAVLIALIAAGSIGARAWFDGRRRTQQEDAVSRRVAGGSSLVPTGTTSSGGTAPVLDEASREPGAVEKTLPVVSEASFFALIGFGLGYLAKKVVKIGLIFVGLAFVALQLLSYAGIVAIDWSRAVELFNDLVLNIKENQSWGEILAHRLPAGAGITAGYLLGFRKG